MPLSSSWIKSVIDDTKEGAENTAGKDLLCNLIASKNYPVLHAKFCKFSSDGEYHLYVL